VKGRVERQDRRCGTDKDLHTMKSSFREFAMGLPALAEKRRMFCIPRTNAIPWKDKGMRSMDWQRLNERRRGFAAALTGTRGWSRHGMAWVLAAGLLMGARGAAAQPYSDGGSPDTTSVNATAVSASTGSMPSSGRLETPENQGCVPTKERILNGHQLSDPLMLSGHGRLGIVNRGQRDAVVKVIPVDARRSARTVYVTAGGEAQIDSLDAGAYRLMFTGGRGWSAEDRKFCSDPSYLAFGEPLRFEEVRRGDQIEYEVQNVTLHSGSGGTVPVMSISEREFLSVR
jgi:hypothetical protein